LEESWGSHERLTEELKAIGKFNIGSPQGTIEENYEEDFETNAEETKETVKSGKGSSFKGQPRKDSIGSYEDEDEDDKIVDEEYNLTSSTESAGNSRKDSDFLDALMKPPIRTKIQVAAPKASPNIKAAI
jgi:hypothetical protein